MVTRTSTNDQSNHAIFLLHGAIGDGRGPPFLAGRADGPSPVVVIPVLARSDADLLALCDAVMSVAPLPVLVVDDGSPLDVGVGLRRMIQDSTRTYANACVSAQKQMIHVLRHV